MAGSGGRNLDETPTWAVATVCFVLLSVSIIIEYIFNLIGKVNIYIYISILLIIFYLIMNPNTYFHCHCDMCMLIREVVEAETQKSSVRVTWKDQIRFEPIWTIQLTSLSQKLNYSSCIYIYICRAYAIRVHIVAPDDRARSDIENMHIRKCCRDVSPLHLQKGGEKVPPAIRRRLLPP